MYRLSKEQELIQKAAREYADRVIEPAGAKIDQENFIPPEIMQGLGTLGMYGIPFPDQYGGGDAGFLSYLLALEQLCKASLGVGMIISVNAVGLAVVDAFGSEQQKKDHMPEGISGKRLFSFAFTEPGTGSDPKQLSTTAARDGDSYIINGTKRFISNSGYEGPMVVICKESDSGKATAFIVDKFCPGYSISEPWEKMGAHGGPLYDVYFKDVRVPAENMLGQIGDGMWVLKVAMIYGKIGLVGLFLGSALAAYEEAIKYAKGKTHRGVPIADKFQHIQMSIADMAMKYEACKWYGYHLGYVADTVKDQNILIKEAALTKIFVTETAIDITRIAMSIHGSYGLMKDYKISRVWGDVIFGPQVEGTAPTLKVLAAGVILNS
ncbi:butyryl-coa dehydrogenase [hydrocarbon metagenome]|uniref:Butyryl-coa dehydrogenase n=1 Tax=hydrocarbon metagenome TaxID=938273 RepID=A0A0W8E9J0_9ZZZZ